MPYNLQIRRDTVVAEIIDFEKAKKAILKRKDEKEKAYRRIVQLMIKCRSYAILVKLEAENIIKNS